MVKDDFTVKIEDDRIMFMTSYRNEFGEECSVANIISKERLLEISNNINCAVAKLSKDDSNCNKPAVIRQSEQLKCDVCGTITDAGTNVFLCEKCGQEHSFAF